jgi:hypothetical protein
VKIFTCPPKITEFEDPDKRRLDAAACFDTCPAKLAKAEAMDKRRRILASM